MCGGHGLHHLIEAVAAGSTTQRADVTQEVKLMYARGDIDTETFHRLISAAGSLSLEEVLHIGKTAQRGYHAESAALDDPVLDPHQARLRELQAQLSPLLAQAEAAATAARQPDLTDEQVRAHLETKQGALFRAQALQREIAALREGR